MLYMLTPMILTINSSAVIWPGGSQTQRSWNFCFRFSFSILQFHSGTRKSEWQVGDN